MDLQELQRILEKDKAKIIIIENGKPVMIVLPYEIQDLQNSQEDTAEPFLGEEGMDSVPGELTIDDLPL